MSDELNTALANLEAIKSGDDPRASDESQAATQTISEPVEAQAARDRVETDMLTIAREEVNRLFEEHDLSQHISRDRIHVGVAEWDRRNGVCKYHKKLNGKKRFGKRMTSIPRKPAHHTIVINRKLTSEDEFIDTVRHELAHAIAYEKHGSSQKHNANWKMMAAKLGADTSATHHKKKEGHDSDESKYNYFIGCPNCGEKIGRQKRSKTIKRPFERMCNTCGEQRLVSFDAGDEMPEENGTVAVESIPWDNEDEWYDEGMP